MLDRLIGSLSGQTLIGKKLVRLTYMDEAGTSAHEPFVVVSAAMVHGDHQLHHVNNYLLALVEKHIPENDQRNFVFSCKNIWSGTKYFKGWPVEKRFAILEDLVKAPILLNIPLAFGLIKKEGKQDPSEKLSQDDFCHALAFAQCCGMIERYMRDQTDENTILVVEDQPSVRAELVRVIEYIKNETLLDSTYYPLKRIQEPPLFAKKKQCPPLQIADMCAFFARGMLTLSTKAQKNQKLISRWWKMIDSKSVDLGPLGENKKNKHF